MTLDPAELIVDVPKLSRIMGGELQTTEGDE
jgi:hypothetical protein